MPHHVECAFVRKNQHPRHPRNQRFSISRRDPANMLQTHDFRDADFTGAIAGTPYTALSELPTIRPLVPETLRRYSGAMSDPSAMKNQRSGVVV